MSVPKGKLIIIGGSVDKGSFTEKEEDLQAKLKFFEQGILNRIITESKHKTESRIEIITTASSIAKEVGEGYVSAFKQLNVLNSSILDNNFVTFHISPFTFHFSRTISLFTFHLSLKLVKPGGKP